jgi:hypothetical protein
MEEAGGHAQGYFEAENPGRRRRPDEDPTSWSLAVFVIHFESFIVARSRRSGNGGSRGSGEEEAGATEV